MGLIRVLGIILIIYVSLRLLSRYVLPFLARYVVKKATENMQETVKSQQQGQKVYQDEKVVIRKTQSTKSDDDRTDDGEYVDFEEV